MGYLNKFKLIHESHSDSGKNTVAKQLLSNFIDQWKACMDKVDIVGTLFIDFRNAFNVVDHQTLIRKLQVYKFSTNEIKWFESYLECQ